MKKRCFTAFAAVFGAAAAMAIAAVASRPASARHALRSLCMATAVCALCFSCASRGSAHAGGAEYPINYAKGFTVEQFDGYQLVNVRDPWDTSRLMQSYILVPDSLPVPENLPEGIMIRTPLKRVVAFSSIHCSVMDAVGALDALAGVCEPRYVNIDHVKKGIADGTITDVGEAFSPVVEKIIELEPDAILATPIENTGYGRMVDTGIPIVETADYMEATPLGRAEWIRLYGLLFCREAVADSIFEQTVEKYGRIRELAEEEAVKPSVLPEKKMGNVWYIPGGGSFMVNLYRDAGADYLWSGNASAGSVPMSFESILEEGIDTDVWVIKYNLPHDMTYSALKEEYGGYVNFAAFKNKRIFACNTAGNSYYEDLPIHPHLILENLVWVFHPDLMPVGYMPRYFKKMED